MALDIGYGLFSLPAYSLPHASSLFDLFLYSLVSLFSRSFSPPSNVSKSAMSVPVSLSSFTSDIRYEMVLNDIPMTNFSPNVSPVQDNSGSVRLNPDRSGKFWTCHEPRSNSSAQDCSISTLNLRVGRMRETKTWFLLSKRGSSDKPTKFSASQI